MRNESTPDDASATPDEGLSFAYRDNSVESTSPSVIARIGEITGSKPQVLLRDESAGDTQVVEYGVSANPDIANAVPVATIFSIGQPFSNHNGGHLAFGPDGMLYVGFGDGGSGGDPQGNGQDPSNWMGSI